MLLTLFYIEDLCRVYTTINVGIAGKMLKTSYRFLLFVNYKRVPRLFTLLVILHEVSFDLLGSETLQQFNYFLFLRPAVLVFWLGLFLVSSVGKHVQFHVIGAFL